MPRTIFHLDLDVFFVAVERLLDPTLVGLPVIVSPGGSRSVVATASYEARRFGVRSAMPFSQAMRLCPQAVVRPGNFRAYQRYSRAFFAILATYSPDLEPASLDEGYLDYTFCTRLFGPALPAAARLQQQVREELGLDVSIGIAGSKVAAKIASDLAKPAGILQVLAGREAAFLSPLPIRRLPGVGPKTEPRLLGLGLRRIGDLARLPDPLVRQALGEGGLALAAAARGEDDSAVDGRGEAKSVSHEETFDVDVTDPDRLRHVLHRLTCEVGYRLRRHGLASRRVCVKVRYADFSLHTRSHALAEATDLDRTLFSEAERLLAQACGRRVRIRLLGVAAQLLEPAGRQADLLGVDQAERQGRFQTAADAVRKRYGEGAARWASLLRQDVE
ncbi:MAG: DNA polymerase IV [candidate division FCPU426 bacterium]